MNTVETENPEFTHRLFNGQEKNCFAPELILGISAAAREKEAAQMFVEFLFSEEQQKNGKEAGFPVRKAVYESDEYWELGREGSFEGASSATYNLSLIHIFRQNNQDTVSVVAVESLASPYYMDDTMLDGNIVTNVSQNIIVDKDMIVQEIYAQKGDTVKKRCV